MKYLSSLKNKNLSNKICLLRVDFNLTDAELSKKNMRIQAVLPTIKFLNKRGVKVIILSHRGRPNLSGRASPQYFSGAGRPKTNSKNFSLKPFVKILSSLLKKPVGLITLNDAEKKIKSSSKGSIFLMENLRFYSEEEKDDKKFAKKLASLGNFYVNDAFSVSHRKDASIVAITKFLPSYAGFCLENEIKNLSGAIRKPKRPLVVILGGAKISDKIGVIKNFISKADKFLIGGDYERKLSYLSKFKKVVLPIDYIREKGKIMDIGPKTSRLYAGIIENAKTVVWNGPMGYIENSKFSKGTKGVIKEIIKSRALAIIGGGETINFLLKTKNLKLKNNVFLSTGGGAMLEYLAGKKLPGIEALNNYEQ